MEIEVELYGTLRGRAGCDGLELSLQQNEPTVADAVETLQRELPELDGVLDRVARAVNDEIVDDEYSLQNGATLALLPPVSGGSGHRHLSPEPLDRDKLIAQTADERCGGLVVFSGDIRNHNEGRDDVVAIEYEAHGAIAGRVLATIEDEVVDKFDAFQCRLQHRVGRVEVGQSSVLVVCRAPHRDAAFRGARYGIDELKQRTPIWKKECYADGTSRYLDGTSLRNNGEGDE